MSKFVGSLILRCLTPDEVHAAGSSAALFQLTEDFTYVSDQFGPITAPAGLITDFASIPGFARAWMDTDAPEILQPSVIHDSAYTARTLTRAQCDTILREAMLSCGATALRANLVYAAVRIGGSSHWKP